jgi:hypothetical protein
MSATTERAHLVVDAVMNGRTDAAKALRERYGLNGLEHPKTS